MISRSRAALGKFIASITRRFHPRGTMRLLRSLFPPENEDNYIQTVIGYDRTLKVHVDTRSFPSWYMFFRGAYEANIIALIKERFAPGFVALDIGAHFGLLTLIMAKYAGTNGRVFAFEPNPVALQMLNRNLTLNRETIGKVVTLPFGLSDTDGVAELSVIGMSNAHLKMVGVNASEPTVRIQLKTLDHVIDDIKLARLDFMKIDTERHDFNVLLGGRRTIERFRPTIVFECEPNDLATFGHTLQDVQQFFEELDYSLRRLGDDVLNFLATPR